MNRKTVAVLRTVLPEFFVNSATENKNKLMAMPTDSPKPRQKKDPLGTALVHYVRNDPKFAKAIKKRQPRWFVDTAAENKKKLLALPVGSPRPSCQNTLGRTFNSYICKSHQCYDPKFAKAIMAKHPNWFIDTAAENKKKLLALPRGSPRPSCRKGLGANLMSYISKGNKCYDPKFDKAIRAKYPAWFVDTAAENKKKLLALPVGSPRPSQKESLGAALCNYIGKDGDDEFDKAIRAKHPNWFVDTAAKNKKQLLKMPAGSPRPRQRNHPLGGRLTSYTSSTSGSFDPEFNKAIRAKQPQWFVNTAAENKTELLAMPVGCRRPIKGKDFLGAALCSYIYTYETSYDSKFDKAIRKRHPNWFIDTAAKNKAKLLALPVGSPRPNQRTSKISRSLCNYIAKTGGCYDHEFDKVIRTKHPSWFVDTATKKKAKLLALPQGSPRPSKRKDPLGSPLCCYTGKKNSSYDPKFDKAIRARQPGWFK